MVIRARVDQPAVLADAPARRRLSRPRAALAGHRRPVGLVRHLPVVALMVVYAAFFSHLTVAVHRGYGTPAYDMGVFDQGVWLLSRFKAPFVTVMGRNLFGDHTSFILLLLVPLYWVYPHTAALLVVQSMLLALGALPVYLLARERLGSTALATVLAGAFLLSPALQWGNLEQFHPEAFLVPLIGFAIYAAVTWRPTLLVVTVALCLLVKEDASLFVVPLGLWVAFRRDRKVGLSLVGAGVIYTAFATEVVVRSLLGVATLYTGRIPFGGVGGLVRTTVRKPGQVWDYLRSDRRPFYVWQMVFPAALAFGRAPEVAAIGLLVLAGNLVSNFPYQHQIIYHYSLPLVPVVAMGTAFAIGALTSTRWRRTAVGAVAVCSLWACLLWGIFPVSESRISYAKTTDQQILDIAAVQRALPPDAVVSAYYPYVSHVDHRTRVYMWPTPFRAEYWGTWKQEGQRLPFADQVEYVFIPDHFGDPGDQAVLDRIRPDFQVVRHIGDIVLLQRRPPPHL